MIRVLSLDLDGTLIPNEFVDRFWNHAIPLAYSIRHGIGYEEARRFVLGEYDRIGMRDLRWYIPWFWLRRFGLNLGYEELVRLAGIDPKPYEDAVSLLKKVRGRLIVVVSTMVPLSLAFFELKYLKGYIDEVYSAISDTGRYEKDENFYRFLSNSLGVEEKEILHVGDDYEFDYVMPRRAGLNSEHLSREGKGLRALTDLIELYGLR